MLPRSGIQPCLFYSVPLTAEGHVGFRPQPPKEMNLLLDAPASGSERYSERIVLDSVPPNANAEPDAPAGNPIEFRRLLRDQHRLALRQDENGTPKLTCKDAVSDYGDVLEVTPLANFPVIRDLVVEIEAFMDKLQKVKPFILRAKELAVEDGPTRQSPAELDDFRQFSMCINCMLCYAACPVVANEPDFLGPAAIALGHRYNLDTRDQGQAERNKVFREDGGIFACSYAGECSEVCPKHVDPSGAIQQAKLANVIDWLKGLVLRRGEAR